MILWDSKKRGGRPDTMKLIRETWVKWRAEVIFITSNMAGNDEMMQGCRKGILKVLSRGVDCTIANSGFCRGIRRIRHAVGLLTVFCPMQKTEHYIDTLP